jgi:hypothetical protein
MGDSTPLSPTGSATPKGIGGTVGTLMKVMQAGRVMKERAQVRRNNIALRSVFVAYAEMFQKQQTEATMVQEAFRKIDADSSGFIDADELRAIAVELGVPMSEDELQEALGIMDENGDNEIEFSEFSDWWVLQSTRANNRAMGVFKKRLEEMVERGRLELDFLTFSQLCFECKLSAKFEPSGPKFRHTSTGTLSSEDIGKHYRRLSDPNRALEDPIPSEFYEEEAAPVKDADAERPDTASSSHSKGSPRGRPGTGDTAASRASEMRPGTGDTAASRASKDAKDPKPQGVPIPAWHRKAIGVEDFLAAIRNIAQQLWPSDSADAAADKLVRRVQKSGGARANQFGDRGETEFGKFNFGGAEHQFAEAIKLDGDRHEFYSSRAAARAAQQDWDQALADALGCVDRIDRYESGTINRCAHGRRPARDPRALDDDDDDDNFIICLSR